ncbi:T4 RnlA family RNA ligase [Yinghuangia sp. YIM S09857]|uniref:T4 RnlA family RNA ligase n=1 Tax=Yinghuangia sp. YIM S09857 TaxID=3436929 RepID=UPI003F52F5D4
MSTWSEPSTTTTRPTWRPLSDLLPPDELAAEVAAGHVRRTPHPALPLSVYAYTPRCVFSNHWTPVTAWCRGLVVDDTSGEIIAHPFRKFFNADQHQAGSPFAPPLPTDEPFEVYDKLDGSLGIVFHFADRWHVATKSAFASEQAVWGRKWLDGRDTSGLRPGATYLAEIIHPGNRIVVDNGDREGMVLLGAFGPDGGELPLARAAEAWRTTGGDAAVVRPHTVGSLDELLRLAHDSRGLDGDALSGVQAEGWVVRFASGLRVKIKLADYVRLHGAMTHTTERSVWEALAAGAEVAELFDRMPDEFRTWVLDTAARLRGAHADRMAAARAAYAEIGPTPDRRTFAERVQDPRYRALKGALFLLLDDRPIDRWAWQAVKPPPGAPFRPAEIG